MGYSLMLSLIKRGKKSKAELTKKANVYYAADQLDDEQYAEIMNMIDAM